MQKVIQVLKQEVSEERLYRTLSRVCSHHRIQTTRSYHQAAQECVQLLRSYQIDAQLLSYPMKEKTFAGSYRLFPEWNCRDGWCRVVEPAELKLADYREDPIQVITQSIPADHREVPLEIVDMDRGSDAENYTDIDLSGKLLFTHAQVKKFRWAFQRGAVGILSDYLNETDFFRSSQDVPDVRNYTGFWWDYSDGEAKGFGFVLSARLSRRLKELCVLQKERYAQGLTDSPYPKANAYVDASIEEGQIEVVEATLPGKSTETLYITAHLCHPYASANDNASGVSGAIEVLIALKQAIDQGKLEPLEKTIKVVLIPEFTGTYCYVNDKDMSNGIAGINLDMIGARQEGITGPITLTHLPYASPSIIGELASLLMEEIKQEPSCQEDILLQNVRTREEEFMLGSDHFILSDPQVGIPTLMLGQMPDLYYHTSGDTLERMDMTVLKYSTVLAASCIYLLNDLHSEDVEAIFEHQCVHLMKQAQAKKRKARRCGMDAAQLAKALAVLKEFHLASAADMRHYVKDADVEGQCRRIESLLPQVSLPSATGGAIYRRRFHDPIESLRSLFLEREEQLALVDAYEKRHASGMDRTLCETLCGYYIDGTRTAAAVIEHVEGESGIRCEEMLLEYMQLLEQVGLLEQVETTDK